MTPMSSPLDCNGVAAAREAIRYLSHPETPWSDEQVGAVINAYFAAAKTAEERKRRAAGPSSVKWPMPDPLAKYKALAPSQTAVEPVAWKWRAMVKGEWSLWSTVDVDPNDWTWRDYWEDVEIVPLVPLSTLTAQAAALVAAEKERDAAILAASEHARARGEAEGALHVSELAGVVDGWKARAEAAEKRIAELEAGLEPPYEFDRYVNGVLMAEGVTIEAVTDLAKATLRAVRIASRGPNGEVPVLVLRARRLTPEEKANTRAIYSRGEA